MKKLLFTDLLGTLICRYTSDSIHYYNSLEKEIYFVSRYINSFLKEGNDIVIITEPGAHNGIDTIFNKILIKLNSYIDQDFYSHIFYYLVGKIKIRDDSDIKKIELFYTHLQTLFTLKCSFYLQS